MSASYPAAAKSFTALNVGDVIQDTDIEQAYDEITAIETALLTSGLAHHLKFVDATYDIGASGATRPRDLFLSRNAVVGGTLGVTGVATFTAKPVISAGLQFPATQVADADANALDDYEEGPWTPVDSSGAGLTLTNNASTYLKIGQVVHIFLSVTYPATASGAALTIGGVPFTSQGAGALALAYSEYATPWTVRIPGGGTTILGYAFGAAPVTNANMTGKTFIAVGSYRATA